MNYKKSTKIIGIILVGLMLAYLSARIQFVHNAQINPDGRFHLIRMASIYQSLNDGHLPDMVNFFGFNQRGLAITAVYPWLGTWMFILPMFISHNPAVVGFIGFFIINLMTIGSMYALTKELTSKWWLRFLGVCLYQFNAYHFILMYQRMALGEAIGYALLPLVMAGLFKIWRKEKYGFLYVGLGMGIIANSHILSLIITTLLIVMIELLRLVTRHVEWFEVKELLKAALLALALSIYSLTNVLVWGRYNQLIPPVPRISPVDLNAYIQETLSNTFIETASPTMGLIITLVLLTLFVLLFIVPKGNCRYWSIAAIFLFICTLNWLPWPLFLHTPLTLFQFTMRLFCPIALFIAIALVLFFNQQKENNKPTALLLCALLAITTLSGGYKAYTDIKNRPYREWLTNDNMSKLKNNVESVDYLLAKPELVDKPYSFGPNGKATNRNERAAFNFDNDKKFTVVRSNYHSVTFKQNTPATKKVLIIPVVGYHHYHYQVKLNGASVQFYKKNGQLEITLPDAALNKRNQVTVTVNHNNRNQVMFFISLLANMVTLLIFSVFIMKHLFKHVVAK